MNENLFLECMKMLEHFLLFLIPDTHELEWKERQAIGKFQIAFPAFILKAYKMWSSKSSLEAIRWARIS